MSGFKATLALLTSVHVPCLEMCIFVHLDRLICLSVDMCQFVQVGVLIVREPFFEQRFKDGFGRVNPRW